jgi:phage baseplate assembly protein W
MTNPIIGRGWSFPPRLDERGTIALASDQDEIEQSIQVILGTAPGQRVMRPDFGCRIHELVFAPNNTATFGLARRHVAEALGRWEPRIHLKHVEVEPDARQPDRLLISIEYQVAALHSNRSLVYPFYTIPEAEEGPNREEVRR